MTKSKPKSDEITRTRHFKRNPDLERMLVRINDLLAPAEIGALNELGRGNAEWPLIFIMGPLRSGTTLFMQWLARTGLVGYPTNFLSRFYAAPVVGALIQLMLSHPRYRFREELPEFTEEVAFESENGKTRGALAPNEFWYFWRRFLPFGDLDWLPTEELVHKVDRETLVDELLGLTRIFAMPFAMKAMILNYNIAFLDNLFEKALFIQIKRDAIRNVSSILEARRRQLGSEDAWYSFRIPEYPKLKNMPPVMQAAGQCYYINRAVDEGMSALPDSRKLLVDYEQFCRNPAHVYELLTHKLGIEGVPYSGPATFQNTRTGAVSRAEEIEAAVTHFAGLAK